MSRCAAHSAADPLLRNPTTGIAACCARAASGHAAAALPSATSNSRRPMVTVMRPSRARCVKRRIPRGRPAGRTLLSPHSPDDALNFGAACAIQI
jgi:hypothetical protein